MSTTSRYGHRIRLVLWGVLVTLAPVGAAGQTVELRPRLVEPALWVELSRPAGVAERRLPQTDDDVPSFLTATAAVGLGSFVGVAVGVLAGLHTAEDIDDLALSAYVGSWLGGALGAGLAGGGVGRAVVGSAVGVGLGVLLGRAASSDWVYFATHAVVAGGVVSSR